MRNVAVRFAACTGLAKNAQIFNRVNRLRKNSTFGVILSEAKNPTSV
jgi:hypothetical protein